MNCPRCREPDLVMTRREEIEIDYCPQCRGVWLDRGELEKLIDQSGRQAPEDDSISGKEPSSHRPLTIRNFLTDLFDVGE